MSTIYTSANQVQYQTLETPAAQGGMANIHFAMSLQTGTLVVLKIMNYQLAQDPESRERFRREYHTLNQLQSPFSSRVLDAGVTHDQRPFLVLEHISGKTASENYEGPPNGPIEELERTHQGLQTVMMVLYALNEIHERNQYHRDISPRNIMITSGRIAKLIDFGLVSMPSSSNLTVLQTIGGSIPHIAPEGLGGLVHAKTSQADIYGVGQVLYRCIAGKNLFELPDDLAVSYSMRVGTTIPDDYKYFGEEGRYSFSPANKNLEKALNVLLRGFLANQPENRYPDTLTAIQACYVVLAGAGMVVDVHELKIALGQTKVQLQERQAAVKKMLNVDYSTPPPQINTHTRKEKPQHQDREVDEEIRKLLPRSNWKRWFFPLISILILTLGYWKWPHIAPWISKIKARSMQLVLRGEKTKASPKPLQIAKIIKKKDVRDATIAIGSNLLLTQNDKEVVLEKIVMNGEGKLEFKTLSQCFLKKHIPITFQGKDLIGVRYQWRGRAIVQKLKITQRENSTNCKISWDKKPLATVELQRGETIKALSINKTLNLLVTVVSGDQGEQTLRCTQHGCVEETDDPPPQKVEWSQGKLHINFPFIAFEDSRGRQALILSRSAAIKSRPQILGEIQHVSVHQNEKKSLLLFVTKQNNASTMTVVELKTN